MVNIDNIIELKRGMYTVCHMDLIDEITNNQERCEKFFKNIFEVYKVKYDTATIRQKRVFVGAITKYFIIERLSKDSISTVDGKYARKGKLGEPIADIIETYHELRQGCSSPKEFLAKYARHYHTRPQSFRNEIAKNRDDSLSDFAKAVEKVYYSKDEENQES